MATRTAPGTAGAEEAGVGKRDAADLERIRQMTAAMRELARQEVKISEKRRAACLRLRDHGITYRQMAEAMDITEVAVFKILKGNEDRVPERRR